MQAARRIHRNKQGVEQIELCKECHLPRKTEASTTQVEGRDIAVDNYVNREQEVGR
jgi:hypothetical protein